MVPDNQHKDIPGNPSTAKSSAIQLRKEATEESLRVLSSEDWNFWKQNGYIVIKNAVPREQALQTAAFLWEFESISEEPRWKFSPMRLPTSIPILASMLILRWEYAIFSSLTRYISVAKLEIERSCQ